MKNIKNGQLWQHTPSKGYYKIISKGRIKIPHVGWFPSVTYTDEIGKKIFTRFKEDFENKFILVPGNKK